MRVAVVALGVLAVGCSALRLTYSQGPTLGYWWLDGYADFSSEQSPRVKAALTRWFAWHRRSQLPEYTALLVRAQREVVSDVTPAQLCGWWKTLLERRDAALAPLAPVIAEIAPLLTAEQLEHMQGKFDRTNDKWKDERLQDNPRERERAALDRAVEQAEKLYGRLTRDQRELLATQVRTTPGDPQHSLVLRQQLQRDTLETLRQLRQPGLGAVQAQVITKAWLNRLAEPPDPASRAYRDARQNHWCAASAALHNLTDTAQRAHAAAALRGWQDDFASFNQFAAAP